MFPKFLRVTPVGVHHYPVRINESTVIYKGKPFLRDLQQLNIIAEALGFSYRIILPPGRNGYGQLLPNGSFTGSFGMLQRGETDLVFGSCDINEQTNEYFRLSYPHSFSEITFMTGKPEYVSDPAVFLHPFSIQVWFSIIACVCFVPLLFHFLLRKKHSPLNLLTSTLGSLVGQGMELIPERLRESLVLGSWILGSALLYYFYAAVLLSFVTLPSLHGIRTIEDLANGIKEGKYRCKMHPSAGFGNYFSEISNPSIQVIGKNLLESEGTTDFLEFLLIEGTQNGKKPAFVGVRELFLPYKEFQFISDDTFYPTALVFAMHKDFCCGSEVDKVIHRVWASGIFKNIRSQHQYSYFRYYLHQYGKYLQDPPSESPLTLTLLKGPFLFLIVSHSEAFLVFLIEVCIGNFKRRRKVLKVRDL